MTKVLIPSEWRDFFKTVATQTAIAIDNAGLFGDLQRSNNELILAYDKTLEGWSRAMDLRDKQTEGHTRRVSELTLRLGRAMEISAAELIHLYRGALLHDVGKLGIPDSILLKPGKLDENEWKIMKLHPQYAYELLPLFHTSVLPSISPTVTTKCGMATATPGGSRVNRYRSRRASSR